MTDRNDCSCEHEFVLVLDGVADVEPAFMDALFEAGCDDCTPSLRSGRVYLTFSRTAPSLKNAVITAIIQVRRSRPGVEVSYVDNCNLVTQAEIARRIGRSRQLVGQYISGVRGPGGFPGPTCNITEGVPLYSWCEVSNWLWRRGIVGEEVLRDSQDLAAINSVLELLSLRRIGWLVANQYFEEIESTDLSYEPDDPEYHAAGN